MPALGKQTCEFEASLVYIVSASQGHLVRPSLKKVRQGDIRDQEKKRNGKR